MIFFLEKAKDGHVIAKDAHASGICGGFFGKLNGSQGAVGEYRKNIEIDGGF